MRGPSRQHDFRLAVPCERRLSNDSLKPERAEKHGKVLQTDKIGLANLQLYNMLMQSNKLGRDQQYGR